MGKGFISRKLDLSGAWYPSGRLWRHVAMFLLMDVGFVLIIYMEVEWNVHGLIPDSGVPYLLYLFLALSSLMMAMNTLFAMKVVWLMRGTRGMDVRSFEGADGDGLSEAVEGFLQGSGYRFTVQEPARGWVGFFAIGTIYDKWYRVPSGDFSVVVGTTLGSPGTPVFIGPRSMLNSRAVSDIRTVMEERYKDTNDTMPEASPPKEVAPGSPVVWPHHQE